jgi:hypothetical protein
MNWKGIMKCCAAIENKAFFKEKLKPP